MTQKAYIGDGVYAEFDGYHIVLSTTRDDGKVDYIFLEPTVYNNLVAYNDRLAVLLKARQEAA